MRLLSIRMLNFRQHTNTTIDFELGLTGLCGPNGAGKTTVLEALGWAIYGTAAARGTVETIRWNKAPNRARVEVEVRFAIAGHEFRVVRTLHHAECFMDGADEPVASGKDGVTTYLEKKIGMTREEFFSAYLTPQKELEFLAGHKGVARGHFLSRVLGYDRIRDAQERTRRARNALRAELDALRRTTKDAATLRNARDAAERAVAAAREAVAVAESNRDAAARRVAEVAPRLAEIEGARSTHERLSTQIANARQDVAEGARALKRAEDELARVTAAEADIREIENALAALPAKQAEAAAFEAAARARLERKGLLTQKQDLEREVLAAEKRLEGLRQAPALLEKYAAEVTRLEAELASAEQAVEFARERWNNERQEATTALSLLDARISDLEAHLAHIEAAGHDGSCTTCERPLGGDFPRVQADLRGKLADARARRPALAARVQSLRGKPEALVEAERALKAIRDSLAGARTKKARCEDAVPQLEAAETEQAGRTARLAEVEARLAALAGDYDEAAHKTLQGEIARLQTAQGRLTSLRETAARRAEFEADLQAARVRIERGRADEAVATAELERLSFSEEAFASLRAEYDAASTAKSDADVAVAEATGALRLAEEQVQQAERDLADAARHAQQVAEVEEKIRHHNELDVAFTELRRDLNDRIRPELSEIASSFMADLTDGRYTGVELDENYELVLLENGEPKPVISGGEEDLANLVLRLSLSQMIAERAGHPLGLLILDEVFGSLDRIRRDNVMQLLRKLEERFEQIILITHVDEIHDGLDQLIIFAVDSQTGATKVVTPDEGEVPAIPEAPATTVIRGRRKPAAA